ncbi:unnamed protein product [Phytophthora fragariaefolia]|uniref:Unnamed protein product n=1 Tax=Phytophthora fragariaefolia TaxID=1490495 RepID=A0A9W6WRY1_9STRA|nr:unnamed protein product [Phytophthora fragariaefolia]
MSRIEKLLYINKWAQRSVIIPPSNNKTWVPDTERFVSTKTVKQSRWKTDWRAKSISFDLAEEGATGEDDDSTENGQECSTANDAEYKNVLWKEDGSLEVLAGLASGSR